MHDFPEPKPKWKTFRRVVLRTIFAFPLICYLSMLTFALFGGEAVSNAAIPIPPDSDLVFRQTESTYLWDEMLRTFTHPDSPEAVREWFIDRGISMTPIPLGDNESIAYDEFYSTPPMGGVHSPSAMMELHTWSALLATGWYDDVLPRCQYVRIYKSDETLPEGFPSGLIAEDKTVFEIRTCWPSRW